MNQVSKHDLYVEALQRSEQKYRRLVDRSYVLVFILDREFTIQFVCDSLHDILLRKPTEVIGKPFFEVFRVPEGEALTSLLDELAGQPPYATWQMEIRIAPPGTKPEETRYFDLYATNMLKDVAVNGFVLYLHNVTGRKQAEEALQRTNFELDSFVYKASHDMRAPLLNLLGLIDIAQRDFPNDTLQYLDYMKRSVLRLDKFILDLANYSRNDRTEVERTALDLTELINTVLEDLRFLPNASRIRFEVDLQASQPVYADGVRLTIILKNLVSNAIKYHDLHKEQPFVRVKVWEQPEQHALTIEVSDNGAGIMETYQDKVFDMFFRATDKSEGSGLGLYIVKKAVEKLRGKIELKTRHREGTTFTITLPNPGA
jgi:PAS domain S-box-containing protein